MIRALRSRLTYANVVASLALFVALGGTSYAATQLARDSVGANQIRPRAVGPSELRSRSVSSRVIRDRTVETRDLSTKARASLRGAQGPAGPQGPTGPAAVTLRGTFRAGGLPTSGVGVYTGSPSAGLQTVSFGLYVSTLSACTVTGSLTVIEGEPNPAGGRITTEISNAGVYVRTYDAAGTPTNLPFSLIVAC